MAEQLQIREVRSSMGEHRAMRLPLLALFWGLSVTSALALEWTHDREPTHGLSFSYPADVFSPVAGDGKPSFRYFSDGTAAKLLIGSWTNGNRSTPNAVKNWMITNTGGYDEITYQPGGRNWFVVSGYRDDKIVYQKVMFSCGGRLANVLAIVYPIDHRSSFDPIVERMEDQFQPGHDCRDLAPNE